jgi:hypothetical protein
MKPTRKACCYLLTCSEEGVDTSLSLYLYLSLSTSLSIYLQFGTTGPFLPLFSRDVCGLWLLRELDPIRNQKTRSAYVAIEQRQPPVATKDRAKFYADKLFICNVCNMATYIEGQPFVCTNRSCAITTHSFVSWTKHYTRMMFGTID